jgi:uncharacterized protein YecE (DUF72 family)
VNYTFRSQLTRKLLSEWIAATPPHFIFAVKAHQSISHIKRLRGAARQTAKFLKSLEPLRAAGKLGPVLFQLPPNFKCDLARLDDFLATLPGQTRAAMEFRHASWFVDEVYERLGRANVALCTADFCYLRLRKEKYPPAARKKIAIRVAEASQRGDVFAYFKHEDSPRGAFYAQNLIGIRT